jgi:hypothetical protein
MLFPVRWTAQVHTRAMVSENTARLAVLIDADDARTSITEGLPGIAVLGGGHHDQQRDHPGRGHFAVSSGGLVQPAGRHQLPHMVVELA